jgi:hypothetical protein
MWYPASPDSRSRLCETLPCYELIKIEPQGNKGTNAKPNHIVRFFHTCALVVEVRLFEFICVNLRQSLLPARDPKSNYFNNNTSRKN